jgi:heat-inducible transcriptional repressor
MPKKSSKPTPTPSDDLDGRKAAILHAVVTEHIGTAQPVGSSSVVANSDLSVSSATIRSEMVALERDGYLTQPHTSAGRIPTEKGYRYFVDHLEPGILSQTQRTTVRDFFRAVRGETEEVLEKTSRLLTTLTPYPSVVVAPSHVASPILKAQLIDLGPRRVLAMLVFSDTEIVRRTVELDFDISEDDVNEASQTFHGILVGTTLEDRIEVSPRTSNVARLVREAVSAVHAAKPTIEGDRVFVGGPARVAEVFDNVETVRSVLGVLEQQTLVISMLEDFLDRGVSVAIGAESGYEPLASAAVIVAPVTVGGQMAGAVGLLGPTRMNYPEALAVAETVSAELSKHFGAEREH